MFGTLNAAAKLARATGAGWRHGVDGLIRQQAARRPERPCLRDLDRTLTYREVDREADRIARFWRGRGVDPGQTVALLMGNRMEVLLHAIGLSRLGANSALVNPQLQGPSLAHVVQASGARALVADPERMDAAQALEDGAPVWSLAALADALGETGAEPMPLLRKDGDAVYTHLFTSGTTGLPKAAPIRHRRLLLPGAALQVFALEHHDGVFFTPLPLFHASAQLMGFATAMLAGGCFAFSPRFSASAYWEEAARVEATVGLYVGEMCRYLLDGPGEGHIPTFIGNGLRADVWRAFVARFGDPRIVEFYGATEGNVLLVNADGKVGSCGRPVPELPISTARLIRYDVETDTHPRDAKGRCVECGPDEPGELVARISLLPHTRFDGYLDAKATSAKVLTGVFAKNDRWFRTGDLLRRDAEGDFFFVDRIGDTFRWKGENVSTQEVAQRLDGAGGAMAMLVYGVEVPGHEGRAGMAALIAERFDPDDLFRRAEEALPPYARPVFLRRVGAIDTTGTMKFKKHRLQALGLEGEVWVRDPGAASYVPLDAERRAALADGSLRV